MSFSLQMPRWRSAPILWGAALFIALSSVYWLFIASDRYVSEARITLAKADLSSGQSMDFASLTCPAWTFTW